MKKVFAYRVEIESSDSTRELAALELQLAAVTKEVREAKKANDGKAYEKLRKEQLELQETTKDVRKAIRDQAKDFRSTKFPPDSLIGLRAEYRRLRKEVDQLDEAGRNSDFGKQLTAQAKQVKDQIKGIAGSVGDFRDQVGDYEGAIERAANALQGLFNSGSGGSSGQILSIIDPLAGIIGGVPAIGSITSALGPYGAAITAAAGATAALVGYVGDVTLEYEKLNDQVRDVTRLTGRELQAATTGIKTISEVFDQDFNEVLLAANTLTKEVTGDFSESLETIKLGFIGGANASGNFLDSIREYSTQIRAAGGDAKEFLEILIRSEQEGIFSDKGIDSIKDFTERIEGQSKSTRAALENAFGEKFTKDLFNNINNGSKTAIGALKDVASQLDSNNLTAAQSRAVLAEVFGSPGEDAGRRFIEILKDVDGDLSDLIDTTDAYTQGQLSLFDATSTLNDEQQLLAAQFAGTGTSIEVLTVKAKALGVSLVNDVVSSFRILGKEVSNGGIFRVLGGIFDPSLLAGAISDTVLDIAVNDSGALKEQQEGLSEFIEQQRDLAIAGKLSIQGLREEQAKLKQEIDETRVKGEDYSQLQRDLVKVTNNLQKATSAVNATAKKTFKDLDKDIKKVSETSIKGLQNAVRDLKKNLEEAPDADSYLGYYNQLLAAEEKLRLAVEARQKATELLRGQATSEEDELFKSSNTEDSLQVDLEVDAIAESVDTDAELDLFNQIEDAKTLKTQEEIDKRNEALKKGFEDQIEIAETLGQDIGNILGAVASGQIDNFKDVGKELLQLGFDLLERQVNLSIVSAQTQALAQPDSIATFGASGIARGAVLAGLIKAAFAVTRGVIQSFADGGQVLPSYDTGGQVGPSNAPRQSNGDSVLAYLTPGEAVLNKEQQARGEAIFGSGFLTRLKVPGFNTGGIVPSTPQFVSVNTLPSNNSAIGLDAQSIREQARIIAEETAARVSEAVAQGIYDAQIRKERVDNLKQRTLK